MVVELSKTEQQTPDPLIGRKLDGRYEVVSRLGEGGVGVVYRGRQTKLGRFVAIKVLHQDAAAVPEWRKRFEREARALSTLAHPNVVSVTDSGIDGGVSFLVMELLQGKTLSDLIKEGPLPLWRSLDIARQLLRGLSFAHGKGIVHRDLKPANVFLQALPDQADHVRLLDFGMAKFLDESSSKNPAADTLTRAGIVFGTPAYMSPEQAKGAASDARTDVYAAGVVLFELLAGRRPFVDPTYEGIVMEHLTQPVPQLAKVQTGFAAAPLFQPLVDKAMAKRPAARYKDAAAMLAALEAVVAKLPAGTMTGRRGRKKPTPRPIVLSGARFGRRPVMMAGLASGIIFAVMAFLMYGSWSAVEIAVRRITPSPKGRASRLSSPPRAPAAPLPAAPALPATPPPAPAIAAVPTPAPPPPPKPEAVSSKPELATPPAEERASARNEEPAERPQPAEKAAAAAGDRSPRSHARNPWQAPVPRAIKPLRDKIARGAHLSQKALQPLYDFAHQNPGDARPWLLLGRAYAQVDWYSDSVERYIKAHKADATSRGDPQMLADLIKAAAHPTAGPAARRAIRDIYGAEAIPAVDKALRRANGDREDTARLTRLRELLAN